ncbi:enoyl-ACP reductase [Buchnera aphidicola]|uniref:Enoyl-[acyl-carrier-protein] reductase [NADH] n=1 Tax=Buchnera aphidicola (Sarucallis kahawaluokalani) TaxID=1241878 RepID=A0A4D6YJU6_9GAMM|nr:SDR family oxidoreductase [Buchnera aphidicola]QCI25978.1 SDR family oxidoreductase [Buchnera aphidicola (Sarucallis kahawaluokalani)]
MGFLKNKKILITGILNKHSIAYGIAKAMYKQNATLAFTCLNQKNKKKIKKIAKDFNSNIVITCNFLHHNNIKKLFQKLYTFWKSFDGFVHTIAYTPKQQFSKNYINTINRKDFIKTHCVTSYSLIYMIQECQKQLNYGSAIVSLTYIGAKIAIPYYNIMGIAKASLEANIKYIANSIKFNQFRINAISSGPIKTISSYNIPNFNKILHHAKRFSPIQRLVTIEEIGNVAAFLCSNLSSGITGQIIYVDGGSNISLLNHLC